MTHGKLHRKKPVFGKSPYHLLVDKSISDGAARQYAYMHWRYGQNRANFEGRESIAEAMEVSERTVTNRCHELEQADWIIVIRKHDSRANKTRNHYHVFEDKADCVAYREKFKLEKPPTKQERKSRRGKGGKPTHKKTISDGSDLNSGSGSDLNSGSDDLDSMEPTITSSEVSAGAGFRDFQSLIVEKVFYGNPATYGEAGDIANWMLCQSEKDQWRNVHTEAPFTLDEAKAFLKWYEDKGIEWPSSARKWNKQAYEYRAKNKPPEDSGIVHDFGGEGGMLGQFARARAAYDDPAIKAEIERVLKEEGHDGSSA